MKARRRAQGTEGGNALRPRPIQPKPVSEMTPEEYAEWSEDFRAWLWERDLAQVPKADPDAPHRVDHMGRIYPTEPTKKRHAWRRALKEDAPCPES